MKKVIFLVIGVVFIGSVAWAGVFYFKNLRGVGPALRAPSEDIAGVLSSTPPNLPSGRGGNDSISPPLGGGVRGGLSQGPLKLPPGFSIEVFAKDLPGARVMTMDGAGYMWVSQTSKGTIAYVQVENGMNTHQEIVFSGLKKPHGLAFDPSNKFLLYFAEEDKISRVQVFTHGRIEKIVDLPIGGHHTTRTLGFGPDGRLYVSIGSSCNVCDEKDPRRAAIYVVDIENKKLIPFASGLRNSVFFRWNPADGKMWGTEMGRDLLGDELPPDEINILTPSPGLRPPSPGGRGEGEGIPDYGWPICYGKNVHDNVFDKNVYVRDPCADKEPSHIDLPAHSAPLGLAFIPAPLSGVDWDAERPKSTGWPEEYWYDLLVAFHGSWNRTEPTGYKIARIKLDAQGKYEGMEDFISGWLQKDGTALGRPVDMLVQPGGTMYISDDKAGVIYKVTYQRS